MITLYGVELYSPAGELLADVSAFAVARSWGQIRNDADQVGFTLPLIQWEAYCIKIGVHPRTILKRNWTEAKLKRGDKYLAAGRIEYLRTSLSSGTIEVKGSGILNALRKRRTDAERIFTATEATDIAWTAINETQAKTNGNLGITRGPHQATVGPHDRTYKRTVIKDLLQNLTAVKSNPFDFEFTHDKQFNTYDRLGAFRPDVVFQWGVNILDAAVEEDSYDLVNSVLALGAGFGDDAQDQVPREDTDSQVDTTLAEEVITSNATDNSDGGLTDDAETYLQKWRHGVVLLDLVVDGARRPFVTDYSIGDYVRIDLTGHPWLDGFIGMFRVEARSGRPGDDNSEPVTLTVSA